MIDDSYLGLRTMMMSNNEDNSDGDDDDSDGGDDNSDGEDDDSDGDDLYAT